MVLLEGCDDAVVAVLAGRRLHRHAVVVRAVVGVADADADTVAVGAGSVVSAVVGGRAVREGDRVLLQTLVPEVALARAVGAEGRRVLTGVVAGPAGLAVKMLEVAVAEGASRLVDSGGDVAFGALAGVVVLPVLVGVCGRGGEQARRPARTHDRERPDSQPEETGARSCGHGPPPPPVLADGSARHSTGATHVVTVHNTGARARATARGDIRRHADADTLPGRASGL